MEDIYQVGGEFRSAFTRMACVPCTYMLTSLVCAVSSRGRLGLLACGLLSFVQSQASIASTVRRMISVLLWVISFIVFLLILGVNINTVIVSGAASLSAIIVALSKPRLCTARRRPVARGDCWGAGIHGVHPRRLQTGRARLHAGSLLHTSCVSSEAVFRERR